MAAYTFKTDNTVRFQFYKDKNYIGYINLLLEGSSFTFDDSNISLTNWEEDITIDFINHLYECCEKHKLKVASRLTGSQVLKHLRGLLLNSKFKHDPNIVYYTKYSNSTSPYKSEYELKDYLSEGEEYFLQILEECSKDDPNYTDKSISNEYEKWISNNHDTKYWKLVFKDSNPIGIILPINNPENSNVGNIDYIGILPEERQKNHGVKLHNITLDILFSDLKVKAYLGMTHKDNNNMIKIFMENECIYQNVIVFNTEESN